jgi:integrase
VAHCGPALGDSGYARNDPGVDQLGVKRQSLAAECDTRAETDALLAELTDEMRPIVATMLFAGLRVSETLGLCWGDLDLQAGTLHIHRQLGRDGAKHAPLKTSSSEATLALAEPLS